MARIRPVRAQFEIAKGAALAQVRAITAAVAKREHDQVMRTEPRPASFQRFVDGVEGAPEEAVRLGGVIVYDYPRMDLVVAHARQVLFERSPFGRPEGGHYRDRHRLTLNGVEVADVSGFRPGDEIAIVNTSPYARKIEMGTMKMRLPGTDHVYAQAQQIVRRTYGSLADIRFRFIGRAPALVIRAK